MGIRYRVRQGPSDSQSNRLVTCSHPSSGFDAFFHLRRYNPYIDSSKTIGNFPRVFMKFNRLCLELNRIICNSLLVLPDHCCTAVPSGKEVLGYSIGQDPSDSQSNRLVTCANPSSGFGAFFHLRRYNPYIDSSKMNSNFP